MLMIKNTRKPMQQYLRLELRAALSALSHLSTTCAPVSSFFLASSSLSVDPSVVLGSLVIGIPMQGSVRVGLSSSTTISTACTLSVSRPTLALLGPLGSASGGGNPRVLIFLKYLRVMGLKRVRGCVDSMACDCDSLFYACVFHPRAFSSSRTATLSLLAARKGDLRTLEGRRNFIRKIGATLTGPAPHIHWSRDFFAVCEEARSTFHAL